MIEISKFMTDDSYTRTVTILHNTERHCYTAEFRFGDELFETRNYPPDTLLRTVEDQAENFIQQAHFPG